MEPVGLVIPVRTKNILKLIFKGKIKISLFLLFLVTVSCSKNIYKVGNDNLKPVANEEEEMDYYYAFTEATKQALFNNYKQAINLYNRCLKVNPESAAVYFQLSNIYMQIGNYDRSLSYAKESIKNEKENVWYWLHLANLYQYGENFDSTIVAYKNVVRLEPNNIEYKFNLALLYKNKEEYNNSLELLNSIEQSIGKSREVLVNKFSIYSKLGNTNKAVDVLQQLISIEPDNFENYGLLAEYLSENGDVSEAKKYYAKLLQIAPDNPIALLSYADFLKEIGEYEEEYKVLMKLMTNNEFEIENKYNVVLNLINDKEEISNRSNKIDSVIQELIKIDTIKWKSHAIYGDFLIRLNKPYEAYNELKIFVEKEKSVYLSWEQLLYLANIIGSTDELIKYSEEAMRYFDNEGNLYLYNAIGLLQEEKFDLVIERLNQGIQFVKDSTIKMQYYNLYAEAYRSLKNYNTSDEYFEKVLKINPGNLIVRNNYSYYLAERNENLNRAELLSRETIKLEPENSTYLDTYGWILFKKGEIKKAKSYIEQALFFGGSENNEINEHYGDILFELKDYENAILYWEKAAKGRIENAEILLKIKNAKNIKTITK